MLGMFCFPLHNQTVCSHALTHIEVEGFRPQPRLSVTSKNKLRSDTDCLFTSMSLSVYLHLPLSPSL